MQHTPVQLTMQPLQQQGAAPPIPQRWTEALRNVEAAQSSLDDLARQLDSALYLDEDGWRQAVPQAQFTAALQAQQRKIAELEAQLAVVVARLEESEQTRNAAEARAVELSAEVENHGSVFRLHYEELLRKDQEIHDLQAVIQALSLGSSGGDEAAGGGGDGGGGGRAGAAAAGVFAAAAGAEVEGTELGNLMGADGADDLGSLLRGVGISGTVSDGGTALDSLGSDGEDP